MNEIDFDLFSEATKSFLTNTKILYKSLCKLGNPRVSLKEANDQTKTYLILAGTFFLASTNNLTKEVAEKMIKLGKDCSFKKMMKKNKELDTSILNEQFKSITEKSLFIVDASSFLDDYAKKNKLKTLSVKEALLKLSSKCDQAFHLDNMFQNKMEEFFKIGEQK